MSAFVVVGGQWGDEGKGRTVDLLAQNVTIVARYSAGNNAGHTVVNQMGKFALHLVPAGIFYPEKTCLIGNGVMVDPQLLLEEIQDLESRGVSTKNLFVSDRAQVLMPYHRLLDELEERALGDAAIGTTKRGIGPAFADKVARQGLRMADLIEPEALRERLALVLPRKNALLERLYDTPPLDFDELYGTYLEYGRQLKPHVTDTSAVVQEALERGEDVLLEGAQGGLLDLDAGTYPLRHLLGPLVPGRRRRHRHRHRPDADQEGGGRVQGLHDSRRQRANAHGAAGRDRRHHPQGGPRARVRRHHRPAPSLRLV